NFAHGSLYMLGMYLAVSLSASLGFWASVALAAALVALAGGLIEITLLRRIYKAPELLQLLTTFALVLIIKDAALWGWGPEASLGIDLAVMSDAFVVVVVGGLGSIPGAFLAALLIGEVKAFCIGLGYSELTLAIEFIVMAVVLVLRPWGLFGRALVETRGPAALQPPLPAPSFLLLGGLAALLAAVPAFAGPYAVVLLTDILVFALFAASLHFLMGPGGMPSFGHAAYFGLGAYAAGLVLLRAHLPMELSLALAPLAAGVGALLFGWSCVQLSGVYLAIRPLAFAQIAWSVAFQWDELTGGSNGLIGVWPAAWLSSKQA